MMITRSEFQNELRKLVSEEERERLAGNGRITISEANRATMQRLLYQDVRSEGEVDTEDARKLADALAAYLNEYMPDQPAGHKWIILCCLYLAMVVGEPLHPQSAVGWREDAGAFYCNVRDDAEGSMCQWCVCRCPVG